MENINKILIFKSCGKISLVLFACFLFLHIESISATNALLRDSDKSADNYFMAGVWGPDLVLQALPAKVSPIGLGTSLEGPALTDVISPEIETEPIPVVTEPKIEAPVIEEPVPENLPADGIAKENIEEKLESVETVPSKVDASIEIIEKVDAERLKPEVVSISETNSEVSIVELY